MWHIGANISTSDLFELPTGGVGFAAGLEYREESGSDTPSAVVQAGNSGGNFAEPTDGEFDLWEVYAELAIPLLSGALAAEELSLEAAARFTEYGNINQSTWKLGGRWTVIPAISFRAQASTGFRGANILELFGGKADNFLGVQDPCNAPNRAVNPTVDANCAAQGVPADFVQPAAQLKVSQGGNPDLDPETSDHFSFGVVLTPEFAGTNLSVAIDYYDVEIKGAISTPNPAQVISTCYQTPGLAAPECQRLGRAAGTDITRFDLLLENLGTVKTSGVDINAHFSIETGLGTVSANWLLNWLDEYVETTATGVVDDRTGKVACDVCDFTGYPEWRSNFDVSLSQNNWSLGLSWRYIDDMDIDDQVGVEQFVTSVSNVDYFDAYARYTWNSFQIMAGIDNLTDEEPPYIPSVSLNTTGVYDFLGQFFYVRGKLTF